MPTNTGTLPFDAENNNRTGTHLATNIIIIVNGNPIGAIQKLSVNETRGSITMIDEVGTDGHIDSAPTASTDYTITCERIRFNRIRVAEAFGRGFTHVKSQRIPFDVEIHDRFHDADAGNSIITTIQNCWIESINYDFDAKNWVIADAMTLKAEDIFSVMANNANVVGLTDNNGNSVFINPFERASDKAPYTGALEAQAS